MFRYIAIFILLYVVAMLLPYPVFIGLSFVAALYNRTYIPILVGLLIDIQFGFFDSYVLWYVVGAGSAAVVAELLRPRINMQQFS